MARDLREPFNEKSFCTSISAEHFAHPWDRDLFVALKVRDALKLRLHVLLQTKTYLFLCIQKAYPRVPKDVRKLICGFIYFFALNVNVLRVVFNIKITADGCFIISIN